MKGTRKTCAQGHVYYKSSDCPVCPVCENQRRPDNGFLMAVAAPARRALEGAGITSLKSLSQFNEKELLQLHGMGPGSLPRLKAALKQAGFSLKAD